MLLNSLLDTLFEKDILAVKNENSFNFFYKGSVKYFKNYIAKDYLKHFVKYVTIQDNMLVIILKEKGGENY